MTAFLWEASTVNAFQTTLNGSISSSDVTIILNSVTGLVAPGALVIDRQDGNGNDTASKREYVTFTGISGNSLTGVTRAIAGSTAQSHSSGALVEATATVIHWGDAVDFLQVEHDAGGKHVISTATIAYTETKRLAVTSIASIAQANIGALFATNSILSAVTITTLINASGASLVGFSTGGSGTGGFNALFQTPGALASYANVGGLIPVPVAFTSQFISAFVQTPASIASVSATILKNNAIIGVVGILAGATFGSSASLSNTVLTAGDELRMNINSTASLATDLSVMLRAT